MEITREKIYSLALRYHNMDYSKIENGTEKELCEEFIDTAEEFCINSAQWSFLMHTHKFSDSDKVDGSFKNLDYGYMLPNDFFSMCFIDGKYNDDFAIKGNEIYFNHLNPKIDYIVNKIDYDKFPYPSTFAYLIASQLAIKIAPMISPDIAIENRIAQQYSIFFSQLYQYNLNNSRNKNPDAKDIVPPHGDNEFHPDYMW